MFDILDKSDFLFKKIFLSKKLSFYEKICLDYFKQGLSPHAAELLELQLEHRLFIFRMLKKKIVCFGSSEIPGEILFPLNIKNEFSFITIIVQSKSDKKTIKADLQLFGGCVSCMRFHTPPAKFFKSNSEYKLNKVTLHFDPMLSIPAGKTEADGIKGLPVWLKELADRFNITEFNTPLSEEYRKLLIKAHDAVLPLEYLAITDVINGIILQNIDIFKLEEVHQIDHPENDYYIFTEIKEKGFIAVKMNDRKETLYLIPHEGSDQVYEIKQSYSKYIEREIIL